MKILLLEDDYNRVADFENRIKELKEKVKSLELIHFEDADSCINELKKGTLFDLILLDHDLGNRINVNSNDKNTGSEVSRWLKDNYDFEINKTIVITHTLNFIGAKNIMALIPKVIHVPFLWKKEIFHKIISIN